ncbi:Leucine-rich repeat-containing N-terminal plant-type domain-containing protein [Plasmodiophora brassicae]
MRRISQSTLGLLCVIVVVVAHAAHEAFGPDDDIKQYLASPNGGNVTAVLVTAQAQLDDLVNFLCTSRTVCPMLKAIKASGPLITHLSWQVGSLTFLTSLDISNTGVSRLPWQVGSMTSLESLDISNTPIDTLPWQIGRLASLISLDISGTRITELPYQIGFLTGLQYFNCDPGLKGVPDGIAPLHHPATAVEQAPAPVQSTPDFGSVVLPNRFDDAPVGVLCSQYQVYADMVVTLEALLARWVDQPVPDNVVTAATFVRECIAECRATQAQIENRMRDLGFAPADCG